MPGIGRNQTVAIIGGGFTGAAIAYHLDRAVDAPHRPEIVVIEPRPAIGRGLAYSTSDPAHRLNVSANRMSLDPQEPLQFEAWYNRHGEGLADADAVLDDGRIFPRREAFGRYVGEALAPALAAGRIRHRRAAAVRVDWLDGQFRIGFSDATAMWADIVIIATTHPPPTVPAVFNDVIRHDRRLIADPVRSGALDGIEPDDRVLIVGTGLTMADIVASLALRGHRGAITAFSRRGQRSAIYPPQNATAFGDFLAHPARSARALLHNARETVKRAEHEGLPWQVVFDRLRDQGQEIWFHLPVTERRRLVRHLRAYWDARRFRIAPQVQAVLEDHERGGRLRIVKAHALGVTPHAAGISTRLSLPGKGGSAITVETDHVVIATGPAHGRIGVDVPFIGSLMRSGLLRHDDVGLGLATDVRGHAIGVDNTSHPALLVGGPLARGTFGELMGLPEVSRYAFDIARETAHLLRQRDGVQAKPVERAEAGPA